MKQRALAVVLLKLLGVYCLVKIVDYLAQLLMMLFQYDAHTGLAEFAESLLFLAPHIVLLGGAAVLLFTLAGKFSRWLIPQTDESLPDLDPPKRDLYILAFAVAGVLVLIVNVPKHLAFLVNSLLAVRGVDDPDFRRRVMEGTWRNVIMLVLYTAIGLYLIVGGSGLTDRIRKLHRNKMADS